MAKYYSIDNMIGENVFAIIGYVQKALRRAGADKSVIAKYHKEVTKGDYFDACQVSQMYVDLANSMIAMREEANNESTNM